MRTPPVQLPPFYIPAMRLVTSKTILKLITYAITGFLKPFSLYIYLLVAMLELLLSTLSGGP